MSDIIISGYHGFSNSGDEALLWAILDTLRKKKSDIAFTVLSKTPKETAGEYGVKSISRYNLFHIIREMKQARMLLFGGGSLLQDVTSSKSLLYYLGIIALAQKCGIKTMLYANGIGPLVNKKNRKIAAKILNKVDIITLRDDRSDEELRALSVTKPKIVITADPAFTIDMTESLSGGYFIRRAGVPEGAPYAVISVRHWKNSAPDFEETMASLCDYMAKTFGISPLFVPMQYPHDSSIAKSIMGKMKEKAYLIDRNLSVPEVFSILSGASFIVGMRLHSLIYATTLEIPAMALVYDPKITAFMESVSQSLCLNVETLTATDAKARLDMLIVEQEARKQKLHEAKVVLRQKAEENASYALRLLEEE